MATSELGWRPDFGILGEASPMAANKKPARILAFGDFSGRAARGEVGDRNALAARKPIRLDFDNFEETLRRLAPALKVPLGQSGTTLEFELGSLDEFHPDHLYSSQEIFARLRELRRQLDTPAGLEKAAAELGMAASPNAVPAKPKKARGSALPIDARLSDFAQLCGRPAQQADRTSGNVSALIREVTAAFVKPAVDKQRQTMLKSAVDQGLAQTMRAILHQADFQTVESLWRGLDFLVRRLETGSELELLICDWSADEFAADLSAAPQLEETALYQVLVEQPGLVKNGGYTLLLGLYEFEMTPPHAELLGRMAKLAAKAGAIFATALGPDHAVKADTKLPPLAVETWKALRALPEADALALATPRFLLRQPYGKASDPIDSFPFEEFTRQEGLGGMLWGHPALLLAAILATPEARLPESLDDLPAFSYRAEDDEVIPLPCTERAFGTFLVNQLVRRGINALVGIRGEPAVRLAGLQCLNGTALTPLPNSKTARTGWINVNSQVSLKAAAQAAKAASAPSESADDAADAGASEDAPSDSGSETPDFEASSDTTSEAAPELDQALADMSPPQEETPGGDDAGTTDADLEALLKSLK